MAAFYYDNLLRSATVLSEDTATDFEVERGLDGRTSTQVGMETGANRDLVFDFGSAKSFSHVCVANHNLNGATLTVAGSSDNATYTTVGTIAYDNDYVRVDAVTSSSYRYLRLRFSGHASTIYIADIFVGQPLSLLYGIPHGFTPPEQADQDEIQAHMTGGGSLVGISIKQKPKRIRLALNDYPASWFKSNWLAFTESMKIYPGYFLWKDGERAMFFTFDRLIGIPAFRGNIRQSINLNMIGFVE